SILFLPGAREDKVMIDRYFTGDHERMKFFKGVKEVVKQKSFLVHFVFVVAWIASTDMLIGNSIYVVIFVLRASPDEITLIFAILLIGALISTPFWLILLKKMKDNKKVAVIGGFASSAAMVPMTFFQTMIDLLIILFILGFCMGSLWAFIYTIIGSNVQDDYAARTGKNQKGIIVGASVFFRRFAGTLDELIIAIVHTLTGFKAGYHTYEELAGAVDDINLVLLGIRLLAGVIPAIIMFIGTFVFWRYYPLTQEEVLKNKKKLKELGL
ncbi:MAG: MFS transporter, partial [Promethearchaeota archaeon]